MSRLYTALRMTGRTIIQSLRGGFKNSAHFNASSTQIFFNAHNTDKTLNLANSLKQTLEAVKVFTADKKQ